MDSIGGLFNYHCGCLGFDFTVCQSATVHHFLDLKDSVL